MTDARPKHKPNEKHTLDEVLKSLNDLVRGEVLTKPAPPPAPAAAPAEPEAPIAGMRDIINSLESLLEDELDLNDKKPEKKPAPTPAARVVEPAPTPAPVARTVAPKPAPPPAAPAAPPPPAKPAVPPPPPEPMFEADDDLEFNIEAEPEPAPTPTLAFPEEMSDEDIAKALADIQLEMDAAPTPAAEPEPEVIEAAPPPEAEPEIIEAAPPPEPEMAEIFAEAPAPALELSIEEPVELAQQQLTLQNDAPLAQDTSNSVDFSIADDDVATTPKAGEPTLSGDVEAIELSVEAPAAEEIELTAAPAPDMGDFGIDFTPQAKAPPAEDNSEDLAPPPWEGDDVIERAEPPAAGGATTGGALGESIELDLSISDSPDVPAPMATLDAVEETAPEVETEVIAAVPVTEVVATEVIDATPAPKPATKPQPKRIPVLNDIAVAAPAPSSPPPAAPAAPENFALELTPAVPAKPAPSQDLHQMAVRVIAKLNIEMRKAGKPPLDAKTINRLQQLLRESLNEAGNETHKK